MSLATAITAVFFCLKNSARAQLFDPAYSQPMEEQVTCDTAPARQRANEQFNLFKQQRADQSNEDVWYGDYTTSFISLQNPPCTIRLEAEGKRYHRYWSGTEWKVGDRADSWYNTQTGTMETNEWCNPTGEYSFTNDERCYNPNDLAERDSCPEDGSLPSLPNTLGAASLVCKAQPDGSMCGYEKSDNGNSFEYNSSLNCYQNRHQEYEEPTSEPPQENQCQTVTTGNVTGTFCPANPDAVCPNGLCQPSCGSFDIGYGQQFGCFANTQNQCDANNDGIIDDACLTPPPSCDIDPNQPHCPTSPEPVNCAEQPDHEYCQTPPPNCEADPTQQGCGTNPPEEPPTTPPIEIEPITQGLEQLTDETKKSNQKLEDIKKSVDTVKTGIDQLKDEQKKTTDSIDQVGGAVKSVNDTLNNKGGVSMGLSPSQGLTGWYESKYPEGFSTLMETVTPLYQASTMNEYLDSWKVSVSGNYDFPEVCVDVGVANFGCHSLSVDPRVLPFIRIILIISALMLARSLVFGG